MKFIYAACVLVILVTVVKADDRQARGVEERKYRYEEDKKEVSNFLNTKNIIRTVVKLFLGNSEESTATSRQVLNVLVKVLDMVRASFSQRARSAGGRGIKDAIEDAAGAGATMLKGYVKSVLTKDDQCAQRHICEASKDAVREGREVGYFVAQAGAYASSFLLEKKSKGTPFNSSYDAARRGRSGEDCAKLYAACNETD
ncbi:hypothetical protein HDE_12281 [Halotydeus destructor]|nr:hypothetical protein HDE_12281 [Halotydeus destructor]